MFCMLRPKLKEKPAKLAKFKSKKSLKRSSRGRAYLGADAELSRPNSALINQGAHVALIVENGDGLADAEAYASVSFADAYHLAMGNTAWADLGTTAKEQALRRGTQYLDSSYTFTGTRKTTVQRLEWPRYTGTYYYFTESFVWPVRCVQEACCELALRSSAATLQPDESQAIKMEKIGPITVEYADGSTGAPRYSMVDNMLRSVTRGGPGQIRIERI